MQLLVLDFLLPASPGSKKSFHIDASAVSAAPGETAASKLTRHNAAFFLEDSDLSLSEY
jgi:hypothetical protein